MTTLGIMNDRIVEEIKDTEATAAFITTAIKSAIAHYENERFWFMEGNNTLSTSTSQEYYALADYAWIPYVIEFDDVIATINSTTRNTLRRQTDNYLDGIATNPGEVGQPRYYSYYAKQLRFWPIPDATYAVRVKGLFQAVTLSTTTDGNAWMVEGERLIRSRAKWDVYTNLLKDEQSAGEAKAEEMDAYQALDRSDTRRVVSGRITPMAWV